MKITWTQLISAQEAVAELARTKGLGAKLAAKVGRNVRLYQQAFRDYEDAREKCLLEHGALTEGAPAGQVRVPPEKVPLFMADMKELDNSETPDIDFHKVALADLETRNIDLSPAVYAQLDWMIEGGE